MSQAYHKVRHYGFSMGIVSGEGNITDIGTGTDFGQVGNINGVEGFNNRDSRGNHLGKILRMGCFTFPTWPVSVAEGFYSCYFHDYVVII